MTETPVRATEIVRVNTSRSHAVADCVTLAGRTLKHLVRSPEQGFQVVALPVILLLLFRFFFGGAISTPGMSYVDYTVPGIVAICVAFNSTATAVGVAADLQNGIVTRFRSMPVFVPAVLAGHVVAAVLRNLVSVLLLIGLGFAVGFRPGAGIGGWLAAFGLILLVTTAFAALATVLGVVAKTAEGAGGFAAILTFIPYASSALVPTESMPGVLRAIVDNQPVTPAVDALRALFAGVPAGSDVWVALVWWGAILLVAAPFAIRLFRGRTRA